MNKLITKLYFFTFATYLLCTSHRSSSFVSQYFALVTIEYTCRWSLLLLYLICIDLLCTDGACRSAPAILVKLPWKYDEQKRRP